MSSSRGSDGPVLVNAAVGKQLMTSETSIRARAFIAASQYSKLFDPDGV